MQLEDIFITDLYEITLEYFTLMIDREDNPLLSKTLVVNEWHYARFSMNGIPNGFGPSGIETKLLTHRYLEQKSYYISHL